MQQTIRILSIQSHTIHGFVGNKAATFPLQTLGFDVDCINTVSLSNHPAYRNGCKGASLSLPEISSFVEGLESNELLGYEAVLTGYNKSPEVLQHTLATVEKIKKFNPNSIYICDPVLGDNGNYYVPKDLKLIYMNQLFRVANIITPNAFESQELSGVTITTFSDAYNACKILHALGPPICVLKGLRISTDPNMLSVLVSFKSKNKKNIFLNNQEESVYGDDDLEIYRADFGAVEGNFSGVGDVFSALVTAFFTKLKRNIVENVLLIATCVEIICRTLNSVILKTKEGNSGELKIIESRDIFVETSKQLDFLFFNKNYCDFNDDNNNANLRIFENKLFSTRGNDVFSYKALSASAKLHENAKEEEDEESATSTSTTLKTKQNKNEIIGIIFDMDGTLTKPGLIDFAAMYARNGFKKENGDIIKQVYDIEDDAERENKLTVVFEEEKKGCENMVLHEDCVETLEYLKKNKKLRFSIATRNCEYACIEFLKKTEIFENKFFSPIVHRDWFDNKNLLFFEKNSEAAILEKKINKPNPIVAKFILNEWNILNGFESSVLFVGFYS